MGGLEPAERTVWCEPDHEKRLIGGRFGFLDLVTQVMTLRSFFNLWYWIVLRNVVHTCRIG